MVRRVARSALSYGTRPLAFRPNTFSRQIHLPTHPLPTHPSPTHTHTHTHTQDLQARAAALGLTVSRHAMGGDDDIVVSGGGSAAAVVGESERGSSALAAGATADGGHGGGARSRRRDRKSAGVGELGAAEIANLWELVQQQDEEPRRLSSIAEVAHLFAELVRHGMRTIAFCTTRKLSELVLTYAQDALRASGHHNLCDMIMSYRGGYTPEQVPEQERPDIIAKEPYWMSERDLICAWLHARAAPTD
jgi:hypothetical protein